MDANLLQTQEKTVFSITKSKDEYRATGENAVVHNWKKTKSR